VDNFQRNQTFKLGSVADYFEFRQTTYQFGQKANAPTSL